MRLVGGRCGARWLLTRPGGRSTWPDAGAAFPAPCREGSGYGGRLGLTLFGPPKKRKFRPLFRCPCACLWLLRTAATLGYPPPSQTGTLAHEEKRLFFSLVWARKFGFELPKGADVHTLDKAHWDSREVADVDAERPRR